jgi:hypothetical protein
LSLDPPLVLWSIARISRSFDASGKASHFAISVLAVDQIWISQQFSSRPDDKFAGIDWQQAASGSPMVTGAVAMLDCAVEQRIDGGDHVIMVGRVMEWARYAGRPLLYLQGRYCIGDEHPDLAREALKDESPGPRGGQWSDRLSTLLYAAHRASSAKFDVQRQKMGLSIPASRVLATLEGSAAISIKALAARTYLSVMAAEDVVGLMLARGLVQHDDAGNVGLTGKGDAMAADLRARVQQFEEDQLKGLAPADIEAAGRVLMHIIGGGA